MMIHKFSRLQYESFICLAFDTSNFRYWYDLSKPLYIERFAERFIDNNPSAGRDEFEQITKGFGIKALNMQFLLKPICHFIHHIKCSFWNKRMHGCSLLDELFCQYDNHQRQIIR